MKEIHAQFTKKETLKCNNYRPITIHNIAYKMFAILLKTRLFDIEEKLEGHQMGIRPNRSTIDNIFLIGQIF